LYVFPPFLHRIEQHPPALRELNNQISLGRHSVGWHPELTARPLEGRRTS
jgi:hypothetical protein